MTAPAPRQRIRELDGLRGSAVVLVVLFHYVAQEGALAPGSVAGVVQRAMILGWTGVDLFFVLSGFLIGGILMEARSSPVYYKTFYVRRFFRIVPIYYLWIVLYAGLIGVAGNAIARLSNSGMRPPLNLALLSHFLFLQSFVPMSLFGLAGAWFGHLWSLAVEEQFYLVAPVVVRLASQRSLKWILGAVIVCVPALRVILLCLLHEPASRVTVLVLCRADALAIGMLAAALTRGANPRLSLAGSAGKLYAVLAALFAGVVVLWMYAPQAGTFGMQSVGYTWMALFYAVILLLATGHREGWIAGFLRMGWLCELGTVSYCIYIIHIVVNVVVHAVLLHRAPRISTASGAVVTVLAAVVTYFAARLSWVMLEAPLQRRGHAFKY